VSLINCQHSWQLRVAVWWAQVREETKVKSWERPVRFQATEQGAWVLQPLITDANDVLGLLDVKCHIQSWRTRWRNPISSEVLGLI
jgi:hypothetical protein